jgi:3-dehydroquinate dehydratase / shikimate dehydrogenase
MMRLARSAREIPKAAVTPGGARDLLRLLQAFHSLERVQKVLLGMGDYGFPTRVLAPKLGSLFCYSSPPRESAAPGHVDPGSLDELYRYHQIGRDTEVYGVIGNPVMHSLSPRIHNAGLAALRRDAVYLPFLVDEVEPFLRMADDLAVQGLSVTIPHKESVMGILERSDRSVTASGACNTMRRGQDGKWEGTNTDSAGFLSPLLEAFGGSLPRGLGATVIGAGGASRAIVHALTREGARVLVLNRTLDRARRLASAFDAQAAPLDDSGLRLAAGFSDLIVQATSVGMAPRADADPLPGYRFSGREVAYDLVYVPGTTAFLKRALEAGCRVIRGRQMLLAQAFEQFRIFTGCEYPEEAKRELKIQFAGD